MPLALPNVTLVTIDTVCHELAALALKECMKNIEFGDVLTFTDKYISPTNVKIESFSSKEEAFDFVHYKVPEYIKTDFVLMFQWDSWILNRNLWTDDFLKYDYVGAPWWYKDGYNVGNSGFCLRSKALLDFLVKNREKFPLWAPEDNLLCREYRKLLPQFKWAPEKLASQFAFERTRPAIDSQHFGFHGMFNWPFVLSPDELAKRLSIARNNDYIQKSGMLKELDDIFDVHWQTI
jgi:hypothetical protein